MVLVVPKVVDETRAFWTGGREGRLMITRCADCGYYNHPPTPRCGHCYSEQVAPTEVSGRGTVYSFTVNRQQWSPDLAVPYVLAVVALEEQASVRIFTNVVDVPADDVVIGMPVTVRFEPRGDVFLPIFAPAAE